ncbi:hypothetical protein DIPPA_09376 [Diplonema papillatum]|nr:hypothetical protein DIPPA_09376 [Diplonema papillatum]
MAAISIVAAETGVGSWDEGGVGEAVECTWTLSSDGVLDVDAARAVRITVRGITRVVFGNPRSELSPAESSVVAVQYDRAGARHRAFIRRASAAADAEPSKADVILQAIYKLAEGYNPLLPLPRRISEHAVRRIPDGRVLWVSPTATTLNSQTFKRPFPTEEHRTLKHAPQNLKKR